MEFQHQISNIKFIISKSALSNESDHEIVDKYHFNSLLIEIKGDRSLKKIVLKSNDVIVYYTGIIHNLDFLLSNLEEIKKGKYSNFIRDIQGEFCLILVHLYKEEIRIYTDKLNSKKLFYLKNGNSYTFSNSIHLFNKNNLTINKIELIWYLSNGYLSGGSTLYKEINTLTRSSEYIISKYLMKNEKYWDITFNARKVIYKDLKEELKLLLRESVKKRLKVYNSANISLSGGYDASVILGLLNEYFDTPQINAYTYYSDEIKKESDAYVAQKQAQFYGNKIYPIEAYRGTFMEYIQANSLLGMGISNISDEINFWNVIKNSANLNTPIFTGEEFFGWRKQNALNREEALLQIGFKTFGSSQFYLNKIFPLDRELKDVFNYKFESYVNQVVHVDNIYDYKNYMYFDHNLTNKLINWRMLFPGSYMPVAMPLLDDSILNFVCSLEPKLRYNKILFRETCHEIYPDLFTISRSKFSNNTPNWETIIMKSKGEIFDSLNEYSLMDELINPELIRQIIENGFHDFQNKFHEIKKYSRKLVHQLPFRVKKNYSEPLLWQVFVRRTLVTREFFKKI